ncbi:MAG: DUF2007 domain-containing protein [Candidatus Hydrogenedentes bacterium]|nr:DUF2007 domain-containing protein [Candidatus Hydrogenedentota bacterium]
MKKVFAAQHPFEAHLVRGLLEGQGIEAEVRGEDLFSVRGEVPITQDTLPSVWVLADSQVEQAMDLVTAYLSKEAPADTEATEWRCPDCGEQIEPQFTVCWKCGTERPEDPPDNV